MIGYIIRRMLYVVPILAGVKPHNLSSVLRGEYPG